MAQPIEPIKTIEVSKSGLIGLKENFFADFPAFAVIGFVSLLIMAIHPLIKNKWIQIIPGPLWVMIFTIPVGMILNLGTLQETLHRPPGGVLYDC